MDAALPRVADAAVQLHRLARRRRPRRRRHRTSPSTPPRSISRCAGGRDRRRRCTASVTSSPRHADLHQHVGAGVLHRLERADRPAELLPDARVADRRGEHGLTQAQAVAGDGDGGAVEQPAHGGLRVAGEPPHATSRVDRAASAVTGRGCGSRRAPAVAARSSPGSSPGRPRRSPGSAGVSGQQQEPARAGGVRHEGGPAVQRATRAPSARSGTAASRDPSPTAVLAAASAAARTAVPAAIWPSRRSRPAQARAGSARRQPRMTAPRYGLRAAARPSSSATTATSANVASAPSSSGATSSPSQPASASSRQSTSRRRHPAGCPALRGQQVAGHRPEFVADLGSSSDISPPPVLAAVRGRARR